MKKNPVWTIEIRKTEKAAFVRDHSIKGKVRYLKTHRCVYYEKCPTCLVAVGEACVDADDTPITTVHGLRKDVFYERVTREAAEEKARVNREFQESYAEPVVRVRKGGKRGA